MRRSRNDKILKHFIEEIQRRLGKHLRKVILFGSRARGDYSPESDYDCLVVMDNAHPKVKDTIDTIVGEFLFQYNALFSVFPVSEEEFFHYRYDPFLQNIRREGIVP
jgi:predicted nucleotidyltransferase